MLMTLEQAAKAADAQILYPAEGVTLCGAASDNRKVRPGQLFAAIPGEKADGHDFARAAVEAGTDGVKFHLLHVLKGTDLEKDYLAGKFACLTLEEYGHCLQLSLDQLPERVVVHRITGDGAKRNLVAPLWSADKKRVLNYLNGILK